MAKHKVKRYAAGELVEKKVNIDNPGAYKVPLPEEPSYEDEGRMSDLSTKVMTGEGMQKMEAAPEKMEAPTPKPKVVTKEELAKSGLTLREYMNQQQGLKPRGESAPAKTEPTKAKMNTAMAARTEDRAYKSLEEPSKDSSKNPMNKGNEKAKTKFESFRNAPSPVDNIKTSARNIAKKLGISGYAKGGSVTASSRGDGIATKGKTRGKIC
jgi:hypothetical protein